MSRNTARGKPIATVIALSLIVAAVAWFLPSKAVLALIAAAAVAALAMIAESYRRVTARLQRLHHDARDEYRQTEALFSVFSAIQPAFPLPDMRGWAASPDLLKLVVDTVLDRKPRLVVEASSGVSTLVVAYCLKRLGQGRVVSLEHDAKYFALTRDLIARHGLESVATVVHAPLHSLRLGGEEFTWYDVAQLRVDEPIDLLLIDGPPRRGHPLARYPAVPLLYRRLAPDAIVVLDDGDRDEEQETVRRWTREFGDLASEHVPLEKGAFRLRRGVSASAHGGPQG